MAEVGGQRPSPCLPAVVERVVVIWLSEAPHHGRIEQLPDAVLAVRIEQAPRAGHGGIKTTVVTHCQENPVLPRRVDKLPPLRNCGRERFLHHDVDAVRYTLQANGDVQVVRHS